VLLIDIDTLRADSVSLYGAHNPTTPRLDAWAQRRATIYRDTIATASWTLPSTTSILTGTYVQQHRVSNMAADTIGAFPMLPTLLKKAGYETWGFADGGFLEPCFGFAEGFDAYYCRRHSEIDWSAALDRLRDRRSGRPLFLFLHTYVVHSPYSCDMRFDAAHGTYEGDFAGEPIDLENVIDPFNRHAIDLSPREREYMRNLYDAGVARMDAQLARFLVEAERLLQGEDWMLVFTSDHGECFFEHGLMGHGSNLHSEVTRVPLMVVWPRSAHGAPPVGMNDAQASSVDIVPTILECAGIAAPEELPGRSLLTLGEGDRPRLGYLAPEHQSIVAEGFRLIRHGLGDAATFELYDLANDPTEQHDLAAQDGERVKRMDTLLARLGERYPVATPRGAQATPDSDTIAGLRALGYVK
jgi:arylsulfatase A-like enzyme